MFKIDLSSPWVVAGVAVCVGAPLILLLRACDRTRAGKEAEEATDVEEHEAHFLFILGAIFCLGFSFMVDDAPGDRPWHAARPAVGGVCAGLAMAAVYRLLVRWPRVGRVDRMELLAKTLLVALAAFLILK